MKKGTKLLTFVEKEKTIKEFQKKHENVSAKLREFIKLDLKPNGTEIIHRDDVNSLSNLISQNDSIQVCGNVGVGKTLMIQKIIKSNSSIFIVFDSHDEYKFLESVENIPNEPKKSIRMIGEKVISNSYNKFQTFGETVMKKKWDDNIFFVIEEAYRFKDVPFWFPFDVKNLLAESRKFGHVIAISQEKLCDFVPSVEIVK